MAGLSVRLLGPPSIEVDGRPLVVDTRKAVALVALIAVAAEPQPRRSLTAILWPDVDGEHASGALRRTLSVLRAALSDRWIEPRGSAVALEGPGLEIDLAAERAAWRELAGHEAGHPAAARVCPVCLRLLEAIVALHRGPFMAGFALRDSPEFDDWQEATGREAERRLETALERLAAALAAAGRHAEAIPAAERRLGLDPLNEAAFRALMRIHAAAGDRAGAIRRYRDCVRVLDEELSVEPLPETTALYRAIVAGETVSAPTQAPAAVAGGPAEVAGAREGRVLGVPLPAESAEPAEATGRGDPGAAPDGLRGPLPFVGRREPLARLIAAWRKAGGGAQLALVEGEPGIGKTRLAEELAAAVTAAGGRAVAVACYREDAAFPYAATVEILRTLAAATPERVRSMPEHVRVEVARLVPELGEPSGHEGSGLPGDAVAGAHRAPRGATTATSVATATPTASATAIAAPVPDDVARVRFVDGLAAALLTLAGPAKPDLPPSLLVVDDAQWIDPPSAEVLLRVRRRLASGRALIVICRRPVAVDGDLLAPAVRPAAPVIRLARLGPDDVRELGMALGIAGPELAALYASSEGVPFYLVERIAAAGASETVVERPAGLRMEAGGDLELSPAVRSHLEARFAAVPEAARQILGAAAVIGRSFDPDLVRDVSGRSEEETVMALEELVRAGLIRERGGQAAHPEYDFDHPRTCDAAYAELGLARRRLLHARAAHALAERARATGTALGAPGAAATALTVARHFERAGRDGDAARFLAAAAANAEGLFANREALDLYRASLALDPALGGRLRPRAARVATLLGRYEEAIRDLETAIATAGPGAAQRTANGAEGPAGPDEVAALEHDLGSVHARRGDWTLAEMHLSAALERLPESAAAERARVLLEQAFVAIRRRAPGNRAGDAAADREGGGARGDARGVAPGDDAGSAAGDVARMLAGRALEYAERSGAVDVLAEAHNLAGMLDKNAGDLPAARRHLARSLDLAAASGALPARIAALNNLALVERAAGDLETATELTEAALRICEQIGDRHREAALRNNLADLLHAAGQPEQARRQVRDSVAILAELGHPGELNPEIWRLVEW